MGATTPSYQCAFSNEILIGPTGVVSVQQVAIGYFKIFLGNFMEHHRVSKANTEWVNLG